jgi:hypothetical protein
VLRESRGNGGCVDHVDRPLRRIGDRIRISSTGAEHQVETADAAAQQLEPDVEPRLHVADNRVQRLEPDLVPRPSR